MVETPKGQEKRQHPRVTVAIPVRVRLLTKGVLANQTVSDRPSNHNTSSLNLSEGGLAFTTNFALRQQDVVKVELELPGRVEPLKGFAEVAWCSSEGSYQAYHSGIHFLAVRQSDQEQIRHFISDSMTKTVH